MNSHGKLRVLLIEDDEDDCVLIRALLSESGLILDWEDTYEGGLNALSRLDYDACLLDYVLGDRTGIELLSEAGSKGSLPPVILLTAHNRNGIDLEALSAGAADYLVKSEINETNIQRSIRYAVERKKAELELKGYKDHLEELVKKRTVELQEANLRLRMQIDERVLAENALSQSEEQYRSLVNSSLDMIYTIDTAGILTSLNPAFEKVTGWKTEEWVGREYSSLIHPQDLPILLERRERVLKGEEMPPGEVRVRIKSGGFRVLEFQPAPLYAGNTIVGLIGTARDITDRKKAEKKIFQQNCFLRSILESLSHPFYVVDVKDYSIVLANSAATSMESASKAKCYSLFHKGDKPCDGNEHQCPLREIKKSKKPYISEHIHYDQTGEPRYVEVHAHPILDEEGEVSKVIEYCLDITDRKIIEEKLRIAYDEMEIRVAKRTAELTNSNLALMSEIVEKQRVEEALRLNERRLEALLILSQIPWTSERNIADYVLKQEVMLTRSSIGAIGFLDKDETVLTWIPGLSDDSKLPVIDLAEAGTWANAVRDRSPVVENDCSSSEAEVNGLPFELINLRRFMSIPVFEGESITAVAVVANKDEDYDQSDLRQLTLLMDGMWKLVQRERSIKSLKETESLTAIGRALSSVAHDMKTPLVAIGGFAKQVQYHLDEADPDWGKLQIVLSETERLEKMVADMLDFSKPLDLNRSLEQIGDILEESVAVTKPLASGKTIGMCIEKPGGLIAPLLLDRLRIKRALINLMTNAIEASSEGQVVRVCYRKTGSELVIEVSDTGPGIPSEIRKDIFLPFFTTRKGGTGLGLPIVKKIVESHKGSIEVLDTTGGASIRIRLPA